MPKQSFSERSCALLSALPPQFTQQVHFSSSFLPRARRTLELRGPVLLLSKQPSTQPQVAENIIVLSAKTPLSPSGSRGVCIGPSSTKIWLSTTTTRDNFLIAAKAAIASSEGGIERYNIRREIGQGASGTVYLVQRKSNGVLLAMKAIPKCDTFFSDSRLASLVAERTALSEAAARRNAFTVRLVDAFETAQHLCLVTELGHFGDLTCVLRHVKQRRLDEQVAKKMFAEIVLGLEESHRMGYLYRDMKLDNLLLDKFGHIRLADFGLAKKLNLQHEGSTLTSESWSDVTVSEDEDEPFQLVGRAKSFVGTRQYMSPEHLKGGTHLRSGYGAPADVWAMGVVLYAILNGELPFERDGASGNLAAIFHAIKHEDAVYPNWLSSEAVSLLNGILVRDSQKRMTISGIKSHPWLKDIDWEKMRSNSMNNVPQQDVLSILHENSVKSIAVTPGKCNPVVAESDNLSALSSSNDEQTNKWKRNLLEGCELLGFGYLNTDE